MDNKNFYRTPLVSSSESWIAGIDERRHNLLKVFVLNSRNDEATEIKAAPS